MTAASFDMLIDRVKLDAKYRAIAKMCEVSKMLNRELKLDPIEFAREPLNLDQAFEDRLIESEQRKAVNRLLGNLLKLSYPES